MEGLPLAVSATMQRLRFEPWIFCHGESSGGRAGPAEDGASPARGRVGGCALPCTAQTQKSPTRTPALPIDSSLRVLLPVAFKIHSQNKQNEADANHGRNPPLPGRVRIQRKKYKIQYRHLPQKLRRHRRVDLRGSQASPSIRSRELASQVPLRQIEGKKKIASWPRRTLIPFAILLYA